MKINAKSIHYKELNEKIKKAIAKGEKIIELSNVNGQRYIGCGLKSNAKLIINGVPGNDLGAFMNGLEIFVNNNCQDGTGNTMNSGKIVIKGNAGDVLGYGMRNGKIFIKGNVGYRVGIHMKEYKQNKPIIVIGGSAGDFLGEYMAGGIIVLLNLENNFKSDYIATGMHGGVIYIRGRVKKSGLGEGVKIKKISEDERKELNTILREFCKELKLSFNRIKKEKFVKLVPTSHRPYGELYSY